MSSSSQKDWLDALRARIESVTPTDAAARVHADGALLVDVRERAEHNAGAAAGSHNVPKGFLELWAARELPDPSRPLLVMCQTGLRSLFAAEALQKLGYATVLNVDGGYRAWLEAGLPVALPGGGLSAEEQRRYARHLVIPEVGLAGQRRLKDARVLMIGAGGLGSPAALYLASAGVGTLGIVDFDVVDESNLQRQVLHDSSRVGHRKVDSARRTIAAINPHVEVITYDERFDSSNADRIVPDFDMVLDGADNFPTRYLVNDACVKHNKPNVHGSVFRFEGQASLFMRGHGPCYRCLYPEPPPPEMTQSCAEAGVLGVLPGVIGLLQAVEAIKLILQQGRSLAGRLLVYDALAATFRQLRIEADPNCPYCAEGKPFPGYIDYKNFCNKK